MNKKILFIVFFVSFVLIAFVYLSNKENTEKSSTEEKPINSEIVTEIKVNIPPEAMADLEKRLAETEEAIKNDPGNKDNYMNLGRIKETLGDLVDSKDAYTKACEIKVDSICLLNLGEVYIKMKDYKNAEQSFQKAVDLYPADESGYLRLGKLWRYNFPEKSSDEIIAFYKQGTEKSLYRSRNLELRLAIYCEEIEDFEQAKFYFEELLKYFPENKMYKEKVEELDKKIN